MIDIVERLRDTKHHPWEICQDAADEIARLRDENATLRADAEKSNSLLRDLVTQLNRGYVDAPGHCHEVPG